MKNFLRVFSLIGAVVFSVVSLSLFAVRYQIINPEMYTNALDQSGIYVVTTDILQSKVTAYLISAEKKLVSDLSSQINPQNKIAAQIEPVAVLFLNSLIDRQTGEIVGQVFDKLQVEAGLRNSASSGITYTVDWLAGRNEDPVFFSYIPEPNKLEAVRDEGAVPFIVSQIKQNIGLEDLPPCQSLSDITKNIGLLTSGNVSDITCYSPEIRAAADKGAQVIAPKVAQTQLAITINDFLNKYQIKTLVDDVFKSALNISYFKQDLYKLRDFVAQTKQWAITGFIVSLILLITGLVLTPKRRLRVFFYVYVWTGGIMAAAAFLYSLIASQIVARSMPYNLAVITDPAISSSQKQQLADSIRSAGTYIVQDVTSMMLTIGLLIFAVSLGGLVILHFVYKRKTGKEEKKEKKNNGKTETADVKKSSSESASFKKKSSK